MYCYNYIYFLCVSNLEKADCFSAISYFSFFSNLSHKMYIFLCVNEHRIKYLTPGGKCFGSNIWKNVCKIFSFKLTRRFIFFCWWHIIFVIKYFVFSLLERDLYDLKLCSWLCSAFLSQETSVQPPASTTWPQKRRRCLI